MAFLRKEVPFGENPQKTKKILYRIDDPFMAFYYRFIEPNKSMIALERGNIAKKFINDGFNGHVAEVWERFMKTYPKVEDLAAASEDDVLKLWQGLGVLLTSPQPSCCCHTDCRARSFP